MSAEAVGWRMPAVVTLDHLSAMAVADPAHRYEMSPEGVLSIMPPAGPEHAQIVSRLFAWFLRNGYDPDQLAVDLGIDTGGARIPDLSLWAKDRPPQRARSSYAGVDGLLLAVEVVSTGSALIDWTIKKVEYAKAGIPHYWIIEQDPGCTVHRFWLGADEYEPVGTGQPLAWLLGTHPGDYPWTLAGV